MTEFPFGSLNQFESKEEISKYFINSLEGYRTSSWPFIRDSARTCLLQAISKTSEILTSYERNVEKHMPTGERVLVLWHQYTCYLNGLILSTILLSSFAIESFTRHCYTTLIRDEDDFELILEKFDKLSALKRITTLIEKTGSRNLNTCLLRDIRELIYYRNEIAHDDPLLYLSTGELEQVKRGKKKIVIENDRTYPLLPTDNIPLNLSHALRAVNIHDLFVSHVIDTAQIEAFKFFKKELKLAGNKFILEFLPKKISVDYINRLSEIWIEKVNDDLNVKDIAYIQNLMKDLKRKMQIKRIK